ncbi:MAG: hypothetical protein RBU37_25430 [Myxococcota bacterium]|jgi:hypothetical protein|nr:hypothetical protein [Myxococcota bacterium]
MRSVRNLVPIVLLSVMLPAVAFAGPYDALFEEKAKWVFSGTMETSNCVGPIDGWVCEGDCCKLEESFEMTCKVAEVKVDKKSSASRIVCLGSPKSAMGQSPSAMIAGCWLSDSKGLHHDPDCAALDAALEGLAKLEALLPAKPKASKWPKCKDEEVCVKTRVQADGDAWCAEEEVVGGDTMSSKRCIDRKRGLVSVSYDFAGGTAVFFTFQQKKD